MLAPLSDRAGVQFFTKQDQYTKATSMIIRDQGQVDVFIAMAIAIQGIGRITKGMVTVFCIMLTAMTDMKVIF